MTGVFVLDERGEVVALEYNELLRRIASGIICADDIVVARILTDGRRRRAGDLRVFQPVRSGTIRADDLPRYFPQGVLAEGENARSLLQAMEGELQRGRPVEPASASRKEACQLLRAAAPPVLSGAFLLRVAAAPFSDTPPDQLPRPAAPPEAPPEK